MIGSRGSRGSTVPEVPGLQGSKGTFHGSKCFTVHGFLVAQVLGLHAWFQGSLVSGFQGSIVLEALWFQRFQGSLVPEIQLPGSRGSMVPDVPWLRRFIGSMDPEVPGFQIFHGFTGSKAPWFQGFVVPEVSIILFSSILFYYCFTVTCTEGLQQHVLQP